MSAEGRLDFCVHIPFFCGSRLHSLIFTFALPVWEHCARPFFYHYSAPLWYCYARPFCTSAELVSNLKFSTRGSQATGSNVVFFVAYVWQFSWNWRAISCHTWYLFNLQWVSLNFYGEIRVSEAFVSVEDLLDFVFIFFFAVAQVCVFLTQIWKE